MPTVALLAAAFVLSTGSEAAGGGRWPLTSAPAAEVVLPEGGASLSEATGAPEGRVRVMVELAEPAAAVAYGNALKTNPGLSRAEAARAAAAASRSQMGVVRSAQSRFRTSLSRLRVRPTELFGVQKALNGFALEIEISQMAEVAALPGVKRVMPIYLESPTNSTSVPFIGAPNVWANTIGLPAGADGTGIRIGIIDSGIDYLHPAFGGPGATATDYSNERTDTATFTTVGTSAFGSFPTAKVVGGWDFAGDTYPTTAAMPDPNPMDCGGHGSHVAGTTAAFGMNADGTTFTGPYDANPATYSSLLVGPGTAPKAQLYGLRVFGCSGSTGLTTLAIDWSMDPNGDDDLSDHLDVINMSLGSSFGTAVNATAVASDNAAYAGVVVVASAGNSGDTFFISGAPGSGSRVIAIAASVDDGVAVPSVVVNTPAGIAGGYLAGSATFGPALTPGGVTGNVVVGLDPADGAGPSTTDGCSALTNAAAVAGNIVLLDRGMCGFVVKVKNAQNAGAIAVIIADNAPGSPPAGMSGVDATITIPSVRVTLADGNLFKANIASLNATLRGDAGSDTVAYFSSRGPRRIFGSPLRLKPDIAAPGLNITSVETGIVCTTAAQNCTGTWDPSGIQVASRNLTISGTSMAAPHMAGVMALLRQLNPDWTVEELKALAMNYAAHDMTLTPNATPPRFGPSRIGAGRVDVPLAAAAKVVAMNAEDAGLVSVTFHPEVVGVTTQLKKVRVVNKGTTSQTFDLGFDLTNAPPGVTFSTPGGSSITVAAGSAVEFDVQMSANGAQMDQKRDPALDAKQGVQVNYGDQPRNFLTEAEGYLTFKQGGNLKLRLPVYMAEKPASQMGAPATITTGGAPTGSTTIPLSGTDLCTGALAAGPTCSGSFPTDIVSLVSPFELQVVSPLNPTNSTDYADLQYAGVAYYQSGASPSAVNDLVLFGLSTFADWSTPTDVAFNVCIDNNLDGVYDKIIYNSNPSIFVSGASPNDNFVRIVRDTVTNGNSILGLGSYANLVGPDVVNTSMHLSNVMVLGASPSTLGFAAGAPAFRYKIITCPGSNPGCGRTTTGDRCSPSSAVYYDQAAGPYTWNASAQGLNFGGDFLDEDLNGASLPVAWSTANMAANGSQGALLLHHHNKSGERAEVVLLDSAQSADLAIAKGVSLASPTIGQDVTYTVTVTNNGPNDATGVVAFDGVPAGVTYVSDDGAGAYVPGTGLWTIGALASGASATLHIVAAVETTDQACSTAIITAGFPLDPNAANNQATVCVLAPRSADLVLGMSASVATVFVGSPVTFTLTVQNNGLDPAYALNVQETFPAFPALNPGSYTASQGVYDPATGVWNLASLGSGRTATLAFTINAPNTAGLLTNQGTAGSTTSDPNTANNTASASVTVLSPAALGAVTKTVSGPLFPGAVISYTIVIPNTGTFDQIDNPTDEFVDVLPASLSLVSASATSGTAVADTGTNTVTWNGSIPAGSSVSITIQARIANDAGGTSISNQGTAYFDSNGDGTNESSALTDDPGLPGAADPTTFQAADQAVIPTASAVGLALLGLLTALGAVLLIRSRISG